MHNKPFEKAQQKYFYSICKCTVAFKLKMSMFSKHALLHGQILSYFKLIKQWVYIVCFHVIS